MGDLEYSLKLAEHGRLSGDLLIVGNYAGMYGVDMPTRKLVIHSYVANATEKKKDWERFAKKVHNPVPREHIADYPDFMANLIPLDFFRVDIGEDVSKRFPNADIAVVEGGILAKVYPTKPKGTMLYDIPRENLGMISELLKMYEGQYRQGMIANSTMKRVEGASWVPFECKMWIPRYFYKTRRIEAVRRQLFRASRRGKRELGLALKQKLEKMNAEFNSEFNQSL